MFNFKLQREIVHTKKKSEIIAHVIIEMNASNLIGRRPSHISISSRHARWSLQGHLTLRIELSSINFLWRSVDTFLQIINPSPASFDKLILLKALVKITSHKNYLYVIQ